MQNPRPNSKVPGRSAQRVSPPMSRASFPLSMNPGNIQQPTSNAQHPMTAQRAATGGSMLDVGCSMFSTLGSGLQCANRLFRGVVPINLPNTKCATYYATALYEERLFLTTSHPPGSSSLSRSERNRKLPLVPGRTNGSSTVLQRYCNGTTMVPLPWASRCPWE